MTLGVLGKKLGMTQIFNEYGITTPVTIVKIGPCYITQIKTIDNAGYNAIQVGYLRLSYESKKLTKPVLFHFLKKKQTPFYHLKEYRLNDSFNFVIGQKLDISMFQYNELVNITAKTIGKGNGGNIKKHHFTRGAMTHGSKHHRLQGSMGAGTTPGRVFPGKRMPGRLGGNLQTLKNLRILDVIIEHNLLIIKGSIPGKTKNLISIEKN